MDDEQVVNTGSGGSELDKQSLRPAVTSRSYNQCYSCN